MSCIQVNLVGNNAQQGVIEPIDVNDFRIALKRIYLQISEQFSGHSQYLCQINLNLNQVKNQKVYSSRGTCKLD